MCSICNYSDFDINGKDFDGDEDADDDKGWACDRHTLTTGHLVWQYFISSGNDTDNDDHADDDVDDDEHADDDDEANDDREGGCDRWWLWSCCSILHLLKPPTTLSTHWRGATGYGQYSCPLTLRGQQTNKQHSVYRNTAQTSQKT